VFAGSVGIGGSPAESVFVKMGASPTEPLVSADSEGMLSLNLDKGTGSSGSNLAPTNPALVDNVTARITALHAAEAAVGLEPAKRIPVDLVTASGSGLDPHISPAAAEYQLPRVARARGMTEEAVRALVRRHTTGRTFGVLGEPVVNVLELNRALTDR
jgi:K+-transporting ATPase ATPase C chain